MTNRSRLALGVFAVAGLSLAGGASARPGGVGSGWGGGPRWGGPGWDSPTRSALPARDANRDREGRIDVERFVAEGPQAEQLRQGAIAVRAMAGDDDPLADSREFDTYAAAVLDQLARSGYATDKPDSSAGQVSELRVLHAEITPREAPHKPVSGAMEVGVSNRGTSYGMALAVDLSKPLPPLISTRIEVRIRDKASNAVLWEGHAEVATREGDPHWTRQEIATRLSRALFEGFPRAG